MASRRQTAFEDGDERRHAARARLERRRAASVGAQARSEARAISIPRPVVFVAGIAVLAAVFAGVGALERSCAGSFEEPEPAPIEVEGDGSDEQAEEPVQADFSLLPAALSQEYVQALRDKADDPRVVSVVNNAQACADAFGAQSAVNLLELAAKDDQALDFVAGLPSSYPASSGRAFDGTVEKGTVPLLFQWDTRWGYVSYCAGPIGTTGCCPTSLFMVYMGLTGKTDKTPADMAAIATSNGYAEDGQGTYATFLTDMASDFGLQCEKFLPSTQNLLTYLQSGYVVICNVGPGDFTDSGHFFVATGLADDGTVKINDPYSSVNSAKTWDATRIADQSIGMYAFKAA